MIYYPNCSELIADFNTHDAKGAYKMLMQMVKKYNWVLEPIPTISYLESMKDEDPDDRGMNITVIDESGNSTSFQYGSNGYDDSLGFRFDSGCSHYDESQYNFFKCALASIDAEIKAYDGGSSEPFERWLSDH